MEITTQNRAILKSYFITGAKPTQQQFADLIDGMLNQKDDGMVKHAGQPLSIAAVGDDNGQKTAVNFYSDFSDPNPNWILSLSSGSNPATLGFNISNGDGESRLFIDRKTGNVGIGTTGPTVALQVDGNVQAKKFMGDGSELSNLSASKITTDTLAADRIPGLSAKKIISGTLADAQIPDLSAKKITTDTLYIDQIPDLSAKKITTDTLHIDRIPNLSAKKITTDTLHIDRIPNLSFTKIHFAGLNFGINFSQQEGRTTHKRLELKVLTGNEGIVFSPSASPSWTVPDNTRRIFLSTQGYVGIGTEDPKAPLHIDLQTNATHIDAYDQPHPDKKETWSIACKGWIGGKDHHAWSDARVKINPSPINTKKALDLISKINLVDYQYIPGYHGGAKGRGVYAQELRELLPEAVGVFPEMILEDGTVIENFLSVNYSSIFVTGMAAIQELKKQNEQLWTIIKQFQQEAYVQAPLPV